MKRLNLIFFVVFVVLSSCKKDETIIYKQNPGLYFRELLQDFSFASTFGKTQDTVQLGVRISGDSVPYDRIVNLMLHKVKNESDKNITTAEETHYDLIEGLVPAGSFIGYAQVVVNKRDEMQDSIYNVFLELLPNEDFPQANFKNEVYKLTITSQLIQPQNWNSLTRYFGKKFSPRWYSFILSVFDKDYVPYGSSITLKPGDVKWSYNEMDAYARLLKDELRKYNKSIYPEQLRHDGAYEGDIVEMPVW